MAPSHVVIAGALVLLGFGHAPTVGAFTPYTPASGWTYNLEAARQQGWPECTSRFVSGGAKEVALATSVGADAEVSLESSSTRDGAFYLKLSGGRYMSYAGSCSELQVDTFATAGINQEFRMVSSLANATTFEWQLEAVGRKACTAKMVSFSYADCRKPSLTMGAAGNSSIFRLHAVRNNGEQRYDKKPNSAIGCADPFAWYASTAGTYQLATLPSCVLPAHCPRPPCSHRKAWSSGVAFPTGRVRATAGLLRTWSSPPPHLPTTRTAAPRPARRTLCSSRTAPASRASTESAGPCRAHGNA